MKSLLYIINIIIFGVLAFSCSDDERYTQRELWNMAIKVDPNVKVILPKDLASGIKCSDYGPGCLSGRTVRVRSVDIILVEFDSVEHARAEAKRVDQYYVRNWLFDDVTDEPVVEDFIKSVYGAKRPGPPANTNK